MVILGQFDLNKSQNQDYENALKILRKVVQSSSALPEGLLDVLQRKIKRGQVDLDTLIIMKVAQVKGVSIDMEAIKSYLPTSEIGTSSYSATNDT